MLTCVPTPRLTACGVDQSRTHHEHAITGADAPTHPHTNTRKKKSDTQTHKDTDTQLRALLTATPTRTHIYALLAHVQAHQARVRHAKSRQVEKRVLEAAGGEGGWVETTGSRLNEQSRAQGRCLQVFCPRCIGKRETSQLCGCIFTDRNKDTQYRVVFTQIQIHIYICTQQSPTPKFDRFICIYI